MAAQKKYEAMPDNESTMSFISEATEEQLSYIDLAFKILGYCDMACVFEFPNSVHLEYLTKALIEINDEKFIKALSEVKTDEDYLALEIPDNETLEYYINNGQDNLKM